MKNRMKNQENQFIYFANLSNYNAIAGDHIFQILLSLLQNLQVHIFEGTKCQRESNWIGSGSRWKRDAAIFDGEDRAEDCP